MYCIFSGLKFIHSLDIIHTDIKPENIMIDKINLNVKLIDFGSFQLKSCRKNNFYVSTR